jgi:hypothetical protein
LVIPGLEPTNLALIDHHLTTGLTRARLIMEMKTQGSGYKPELGSDCGHKSMKQPPHSH